jgi:hypothetical protein
LAKCEGIQVVVKAKVVDYMTIVTQDPYYFARQEMLAECALVAEKCARNTRCHGNRVLVTKSVDDPLN